MGGAASVDDHRPMAERLFVEGRAKYRRAKEKTFDFAQRHDRLNVIGFYHKHRAFWKEDLAGPCSLNWQQLLRRIPESGWFSVCAPERGC